MRRIPSVVVILLLILGCLTLYLLIARPVIVLPPVTLSLSESNAVAGYEQLLGINQLDLTLTTNGRLAVAADGQTLAYLSYDPGSLKNVMDLAASAFLPPFAGTMILGAILVVIYFFPQLVYTLFLTALYTYYLIPIEITLRLVRG